MNKLFTKIAFISAGFAMAIGMCVFAVNKKERLEAKADGEIYKLVTDVSELVSGNTYAIANGVSGSVKFMSTTQNSNNRGVTSGVTVSEDKVSLPDKTQLITLGGTTGSWTLSPEEGQYLYAASSSNNYLKTRNSNDDNNSKWDIAINESGVATINAIGSNTRNNLRYNKSNDIFSCYANSSSTTDFPKVALYTLESGYSVTYKSGEGTGDDYVISDVSGNYTLLDHSNSNLNYIAQDGYVFNCWSIVIGTNDPIVKKAGEKVVITADTVITATWAHSYSVTYSAGEHGTGSFLHENQPEGDYELLPFASTGLIAEEGYRFAKYSVGGVDKKPGDVVTLNTALEVTAVFEVKPLETTYDFEENYETYASAWKVGDYSEATLTGKEDVGGAYSAVIELKRINKLNEGVGSAYPYVASPKSQTTSPILVFTLTEENYLIKDVEVTFVKRMSNEPTFNLYAGSECEGSALATADLADSTTLSVSDLNSLSFSLDCVATSASNNVGAGLKSIYITIEASGAGAWAQSFIDGLTCDNSGETAPSSTEWNALGDTFDALSDADKSVLRTAAGSKNGTVIEKAIAKYDYVLSKYGTDTTKGGYENFINRNVSLSNFINQNNQDFNSIILIVIVSSFSAVILIGAVTLMILKRRKHK